MSYTKQQISSICTTLGPTLKGLPLGVDGVHLWYAISGNESSFGANCTPRHEPAYDVGGSTYTTNPRQRSLVAQFGKAAAMSYGPWQVMFYNFPDGTTPDQLSDLDTVAQGSINFMNQELARMKPNSLGAIGSIWNAGHVLNNPGPGVRAYVQQLIKNYSVPLVNA